MNRLPINRKEASILTGLLRLAYTCRAPKWRNWQTRATQNRVPPGMWVRLPPSASGDYSTGGPASIFTVRAGFLVAACTALWHNASLRRILNQMGTTSRILLGLALGLVIGLLYGWVIRPVEYVDTAPNALREDFRSDYVLAIAEAYLGHQDLAEAQVHLGTLGPEPAVNYVVDAIDYGVEHDMGQRDLETLNQLAVALRDLPSAPEIGSP
jgi:hypothetical protein